MTSYQKAVQALKECVKDAMDSNVSANIQGELWRHYQGMKAIDDQLTKKGVFSYKLDAIDDYLMDTYDPDYNVQAAQPVNLDTYGKDVITFS